MRTIIVLTVIALGLWGILLKPMFITQPVNASSGVMDVNIKKIDGRSVSNNPLKVNIRQIGGFTVYNPVLKVSVQE